MRLAPIVVLSGLLAIPGSTALAGGGLGLPDLTNQMRRQSDASVQRFRGAASSGRKQRQEQRLKRQARERAFRDKRRKRQKQLEESGLLVPKP